MCQIIRSQFLRSMRFAISEAEVLANSEMGETMAPAKLLERTTSIEFQDCSKMSTVSCKHAQTSRHIALTS